MIPSDADLNYTGIHRWRPEDGRLVMFQFMDGRYFHQLNHPQTSEIHKLLQDHAFPSEKIQEVLDFIQNHCSNAHTVFIDKQQFLAEKEGA